MSYMYYSMVGTFTTIIVAVVVSYFSKPDDDEYDKNLLHPMVHTIGNWFTRQESLSVAATTDTTSTTTITTGKSVSINEIEAGTQAIANSAFLQDDAVDYVPSSVTIDKSNEFSQTKLSTTTNSSPHLKSATRDQILTS